MKLGIRNQKDCRGQCWAVPYNVATGEAIEGLTAVKIDCEVGRTPTCTATFFVHNEDGSIRSNGVTVVSPVDSDPPL